MCKGALAGLVDVYVELSRYGSWKILQYDPIWVRRSRWCGAVDGRDRAF
jgi:hypothetical protein